MTAKKWWKIVYRKVRVLRRESLRLYGAQYVRKDGTGAVWVDSKGNVKRVQVFLNDVEVPAEVDASGVVRLDVPECSEAKIGINFSSEVGI